jgi:hypothetical protein
LAEGWVRYPTFATFKILILFSSHRIQTPRSCNRSSPLRYDSGNGMQSITARRMNLGLGFK